VYWKVFKVSTDETIEHIQVFTGLCALYTELSHRKSLFRQNCHAQLQLLIEPSVGGVILLLCVSVSVCLSVCLLPLWLIKIYIQGSSK